MFGNNLFLARYHVLGLHYPLATVLSNIWHSIVHKGIKRQVARQVQDLQTQVRVTVAVCVRLPGVAPSAVIRWSGYFLHCQLSGAAVNIPLLDMWGPRFDPQSGGIFVLHNLRSGCEYLATIGVNKLARGIYRVPPGQA